MNKDLYIALLEEHVDDLTTAMKIDTVLSLRKTEKIKEFKSELASVRDWNKAQEELISKIADTAMDYQDYLEDLQADWADDRIDCIEESDKIQINYVGQVDELRRDFTKTLETIKERETRECDLNMRLQGKIAELEADNSRLRSVTSDLEILNHDMRIELEKLKKQNETLKKQSENLIEDLETAQKRLRTEAQR